LTGCGRLSEEETEEVAAATIEMAAAVTAKMVVAVTVKMVAAVMVKTVAVRGHPSVSLLPISSHTLHPFICIPLPHLCTIFKDHT
jgi:hypothetical protein